MLNVANNINEAWLSPSRQLEARITMNGEVYDNSSITSFSFDSGSISGESFQIGSAYMNQVQIVFPSVISTVAEDQELTIEVGILVDDVYHYTKLGKFIISEFDRNQNDKTTTVTAVDQMILLEGPYVSKITYPARICDVALEIANLAGVEIDQPSFSTLPTTTIKKPEGYTYRQAIGLIAQFEGGFANFNRDGKLQVRRLAPTAFTITPDNYLLKGFTKNETTYRPNGIVVRTGDEESDVLRVGSNSGNIIELENKVMTQTLLNSIWNRVKDISYFPYEVKWQGNPNLEAGDWFYIVDREGNRYSVPNLSFSFNYNGGMSAESKATTTSNSEVTYRYRGSLKQQIEEIKGVLEGANGWNSNYYDSETEPPNPKIGDLWFKKNGADNEIWIYRLVDGVAKWELEISSAPNQELLDAIQEAIDASNAAKQAGEEAKAAGERAEQLGNEAKQVGEEAKQAGEEAKAEAELAKIAGEDAKAAGQRAESLAGQAKTESATAINNANNAVSKANQAVEDAGFSKTVAQDAQQLADEAKQDALNAVSQAGTAKQIAESASSAASGAVTTANQAKQDAINAVGQAGTAITDAKAALDAYNNMEIVGRNYLRDTAGVHTYVGEAITNSTSSETNFLFSLPMKDFAKAGDTFIFSATIDISGSGFSGQFRPQTAYGYWTSLGNAIPITKAETINLSVPLTINQSMLDAPITMIQIRYDNVPATVRLDFSKVMLSKGNKAKDWTPALEDVQVQISTINGELSQKVSQTTFNTLQGTVSSQGTQINQNKSDIALKANQSTVNTLTGRVSTAEGQINVQAGQIAQRLTATQVDQLVSGKGYATQSSVNSQVSTINGKLNEHTSQLSTVTAKVDNIQIGGRNYFTLQTPIVSKQYVRDIARNQQAAPNGFIFTGENNAPRSLRINKVIDGNGWWTVSGYVRGSQNLSIGFTVDICDSESKKIVTSSSDNSWTYFELSAEVTNYSDSTYNFVDFDNITNWAYYFIKDFKVEKGNKATDWTPAPEDQATVSELTSKTNTINQRISENENNITAVVNTTTTQSNKITSLESKVTVAEGNITATNTKVTSNATEIGTLKSSYDTLNSTIAKVQSDSEILSRASSGLCLSTDPTFENGTGGVSVYNVTDNGNVTIVRETFGSQPTGDNRLKITTTGAVSPSWGGIVGGYRTGRAYAEFVIRFTANLPQGRQFNIANNQLGDEWTRKWLTDNRGTGGWTEYAYYYKCGSSGTFSTFGHLFISGGSTPTTASPLIWYLAKHEVFDISKSQQLQFSSLEQTIDGFKQTVQSTYATQTSLNTVSQTVNSTTQTIATMQTDLNGKATTTALNSVKNTVDSHTQTISSHDGRIATAQQSVDGLKNVVTKVQSDSELLARAGNGYSMSSDPCFEKGTGGITLYNNAGNENVVITRKNGVLPIPQSTGIPYYFEITTNGVASPNHGGILRSVTPRANGEYIVKFIAFLPLGRWFEAAQNGVTGMELKWLTSREGTESWTEYAYYYRWGNTDSGNFGHLSVKGGNAPFTWYLARHEVIDITKSQQQKFTALEQTINGFQQIVADKADKTTVSTLASQWQTTTELANGHTSQISNLGTQINLRLTQAQVDQSILTDKKVKDTRNANQLPSWYNTYFPMQVVKEFKTASIIGLSNVGNFASLETDVPWNHTSGGFITQTANTNAGVYQRFSNADYTAWGAWAKIADTSNVVSQINLSTEGVLIQGKKITIDGETYITNGVIKNAHIADLAVTNAKIGNLSVNEGKIANAAITTLKVADAAISNAKIANLAVDEAKIASLAVDTGHIKDLAVSNAKIANLAVSNAKIADAAITSAKIGDAAIVNAKIANGAIDNAKIQDASINSAKISSIDAGKINASALSAITTNTGALNVSGWLDFSTENRGLRGSYDFGDSYGEAFNYRWFTGDFRLSHRHLYYSGKVYSVNSNNTRGSYLYDAETFYGIDYLKMRQYNSSGTLLQRIDINSDAITMGSGAWGTSSNTIIRSDGTADFYKRINFNGGIDVFAPNDIGIRTGRLDAPPNYMTLYINQKRDNMTDMAFTTSNIYFNEKRTTAADFRIGIDGGGKVVASKAVYDRTYNSQPTMCITDAGTFGRIVSARKYKTEIQYANDLVLDAKKVLQLQPKSWLAKREVEQGVIPPRYYGFIADEFDEIGLKHFVQYNSKGEVEGLSNDLLTTYHNVILKEHDDTLQSIKNDNFNRDFEIQKLKFEIQRLNMEIESLRQSA